MEPNKDLLGRLDRLSARSATVHQKVELFARLDEWSTQSRMVHRNLLRVVKLSQAEPELHAEVLSGIGLCGKEPLAAIVKSRRALERIAGEVYAERVQALSRGSHKSLDDMLAQINKGGHIPPEIMRHARTVQQWGNVGPHPKEGPVTTEDALLVLGHLVPVLRWYFTRFRAGEVPTVTALLWWVENWRRSTRWAAMLLVVTCFAAGSYFAYQLYTHVDPCEIEVVRCPDDPFPESPEENAAQPLKPPADQVQYCTLTILNNTGRPIRLWRYLITPPDPAIRSSSSESEEQSAHQDCPHWKATVVCQDKSDGLAAINGWAYVAIEDLAETQANLKQGDDSHGLWFTTYANRWIFFPFKQTNKLRISASFFTEPNDKRNLEIVEEAAGS